MEDLITKMRQEKLKETEKSLKLAGCEKCITCNTWMDKTEINNGICNQCN